MIVASRSYNGEALVSALRVSAFQNTPTAPPLAFPPETH